MRTERRASCTACSNDFQGLSRPPAEFVRVRQFSGIGLGGRPFPSRLESVGDGASSETLATTRQSAVGRSRDPPHVRADRAAPVAVRVGSVVPVQQRRRSVDPSECRLSRPDGVPVLVGVACRTHRRGAIADNLLFAVHFHENNRMKAVSQIPAPRRNRAPARRRPSYGAVLVAGAQDCWFELAALFSSRASIRARRSA